MATKKQRNEPLYNYLKENVQLHVWRYGLHDLSNIFGNLIHTPINTSYYIMYIRFYLLKNIPCFFKDKIDTPILKYRVFIDIYVNCVILAGRYIYNSNSFGSLY